MEQTVTIGFHRSGHRDSSGRRLSEGSEIPTMRPRSGADLQNLIRELEYALDNLSRTPCSFWACNGPRRPQHMVTCCKCWAMRQIAIVLATLRLHDDVGNRLQPAGD